MKNKKIVNNAVSNYKYTYKCEGYIYYKWNNNNLSTTHKIEDDVKIYKENHCIKEKLNIKGKCTRINSLNQIFFDFEFEEKIDNNEIEGKKFEIIQIKLKKKKILIFLKNYFGSTKWYNIAESEYNTFELNLISSNAPKNNIQLPSIYK